MSKHTSTTIMEAVDELRALVAELQRRRDEYKQQRDELLAALKQAHASLVSIWSLSGNDELMADLEQVKGYARNRSIVAAEAMAKAEGKNDGAITPNDVRTFAAQLLDEADGPRPLKPREELEIENKVLLGALKLIVDNPGDFDDIDYGAGIRRIFPHLRNAVNFAEGKGA